MTDDFEARVGTWLREAATPDPGTVASLSASIAVLPVPRGRRVPRLLASAAVLAILAVSLSSVFLVSRPSGSAPTGPASPVPPDPAAFAGDPRLATCLGAAGEVEYVFEMPRARDYQRHFPAMLLSPELDVDEPGFVVVFAKGAVLLVGGGGSGPTPAPGTAPPGTDPRSICILVGDSPNLYRDVDITGMRVDLGDGVAGLSPSPSSSSAPPGSPTLPPLPPPGAGGPIPPDPAAFASDPRYLKCSGTPGTPQAAVLTALYAFETPHARDVRAYLPGLVGAIEMESDDPALVVIYADIFPPGMVRGGVRDPGTPERTQRPGTHDVCVVIGSGAGGDQIIYMDVPMDGFDITLAATGASAGPTSEVLPVSASNPSAEARAVFSACHLGDQIPLDRTTGIGKIASAADLFHYIPLSGREPQLSETGGAWVVTVEAEVPQPGGSEVWVNPACVVTAANAGWIAVGPVRNLSTGAVLQPPTPISAPDRSLPALLP